MFAWATIAHEATPLDAIGISTIADEAGTRAALLYKLGPKSGFYMFPSKATMDAAGTPYAKAALEKGPYGVIIYNAPGPGAAGLSGRQIGFELLFELVEAMILALLLTAVAQRAYFLRVAFAVGVGLAAVMTTNATYWTFYRFPLDYTLAYGAIDLVRYLIAGAVISLILKPEVSPT